jgi:predicted nuclease of predicted toxin-antitoxin system
VKLLVDGCLSPATVERLLAAGHDVEWVGTWERDPGDREILTLSREAERVLVTTDRGFGALAMRERRAAVGLIVIRRTAAIDHAWLTSRVIRLHEPDLTAGAVIVASLTKIRVRWPPADA